MPRRHTKRTLQNLISRNFPYVIKDVMMVTSTITSGEKLLAISMCVRSDDALSHLLIVGWGKTMGV